MKIYKKAILPLGFQANAVACGIKKSGKLDLALFYSAFLAKAACQFTKNKIQGAPVKLCRKYLKKGKSYQAIVVNSGNANCFTGNQGVRDAEETAREVAKALGLKKENILVASTGIIGTKFPLFKIKQAIPDLINALSRQGINKAKFAIMTTDKFTKEITVKFNLLGYPVTICGIAKGAGMIAPDMATMLVFLFTDADISMGALNQALKTAVNNSFNCITVDGCMSTNDSVMLLANAKAGNAAIEKGRSLYLFQKALNFICLELAKMIIKDAEGATKFIEIEVAQAKNFQEAKKAALAVANSNLFKTAVYGENPNFGRIVSAIGASGVTVKEKSLKIKVSPLNKKEVKVHVSLGQGKASAVVYTSDLTPEYIRINAEYN